MAGGGIGLVLIGHAAWAQQAPAYQPAPSYAQAPVYQQPQNPTSPEYFASNLGIYYRLVPYYGGGSPGPYAASAPAQGGYAQAPVPYQQPLPQAPPGYGARLSRYPVPNSPAAQLQLEPGDMIVSLDYQPINNSNDVLAHTNWTNMSFVNIRTGLPQTANVYVP